MEKINSLTSANIVADNIELLKQLFPTIVKEGNIDLNELKALLGETVEEKEEYYRFTWAGKNQARLEANKPTTATLRPNKADSKDWDTTNNIFIEGDNLEVLKLLQKSYANKIKMIYIDPPYNTGKDFVYKDNYADNLGNYLNITNQTDEQGKKTSTNTESDGRYHSNWLNMMYPRLRLANNLLMEDGLIFLSIDDHEYHNLRKLCDEIFGEDNFIENYIWESTFRPDNSSKLYRENSQYVLCFAKNKKRINQLIGNSGGSEGLPSLTKNSMNEAILNFPKNEVIAYLEDGFYEKGIKKSGYELLDDIEIKNNLILNSFRLKGRVIWGQDYLENEMSKGTKIIIKSDGFVPYSQKTENSILAPNTLIPNDIVGDVLQGRAEVNTLFKKSVFDYPKPTSLISYLCKFIDDKDFIVLDFFAGSGSTSHSIMKLNSEDEGLRKCISVQLPELTSEDSIAFSEGYFTIAEITKERIRRAGEKIKKDYKDNKEVINKLDVGFKAFKLDSSNIQAWDGNPDNLEEQLDIFANNIKTDRTEEDILFEILLKYGLDLTVAIEEKTIAGQKVFSVGQGTLFICLSNAISPAVSEGIGTWKQELNPTICRVIFKDMGFQSDKDKTNAMQILKRFGIEEVNSI